MNTMKNLRQNPLFRIFILLALITAIVFFLIMDANSFAPRRFTIRRQTLESETIPRDMDGMNILFFSDLEYGTFMDETRLAALTETINNAAADTVIFGGDLFDYQASVTEENTEILKKYLSSIRTSYGKFAVLGDNDHKDEDMLAAVTSILEESGFEILNNRSILLHKGSIPSVTLVGLDNGLNGMQDIDAAYSSVSRSGYVITVCHTPDTAPRVPGDLTDYFISGHSHGGQVFYFFGALYTPAMATEYLRGSHSIRDEFILDISNGVGTTQKDARFLANAEVVLYRLKSDEPLPTPAPSLVPEETPEENPEEAQVPEETSPEETSPEEAVPAEEPAAEEPVQEEYQEETPEEEYYEEPQPEEAYDENYDEGYEESYDEGWDEGETDENG